LFVCVQETYFPYLLRSKVKLLLQGDQNQQTLLTFVDAALKDVEKKAHLEVRQINHTKNPNKLQ
jgi:DNA-dependent protein kinase catalytic subunit